MVQVRDTAIVLDREQLRDITMDDQELMREILFVLIEDTSQQVGQLESAIREEDAPRCMRLAHYSKGACANVGANAAAQVFKDIEELANDRQFRECGISLAALGQVMDRL